MTIYGSVLILLLMTIPIILNLLNKTFFNYKSNTSTLSMNKHFFAVFFLIFAYGDVAARQEGAQVGYCKGPPCCQYEASSCSEYDNRTLIGMSHITSGPKALCTKIMNSHWSYIPLLIDHTVPQEEAKEYLPIGDRSASIAQKAGYFDINNDGKNEYLGWLQLYSGAGQGCDIEIFVELNSERTHLKNSSLSKLLSDYSCSDYNRAFRFEGKTYIENRRTIEQEDLNFGLPSILTEVFIIEGESKRVVCTFELNASDN